MRGRPVLVGVDDSDAGREAALLGSRVASAAASPLHLITATLDALSEVTAARLGLDVRPLEEALEREALTRVRARLRGSLPEEVLECRLTARTGRPERVLVDAARELEAGAIVIGGKSRRGVSSWFRRGTAHHLLRRLDVPLLVSGPRSTRIARVLVAVDLSFAAAIAISAAEELAGLLGVPLEALHVIDDSMFSSGPRLPFDRERLVRTTRERLEAEIWPLLGEGRARATLVGPVTETLAGAVLGARAALLVVGTHGLGWGDRLLLGSTTETLLARLPSSLLVVPCLPSDGEVAP